MSEHIRIFKVSYQHQYGCEPSPAEIARFDALYKAHPVPSREGREDCRVRETVQVVPGANERLAYDETR